MKIISFPLRENQFFARTFKKRQIVLHHTASSDVVANVVHGWNASAERIGTAFIIDRQGKVYQTFPEECWAWHLGMKHPRNTIANQLSIGIELTNWGFLTQQMGKFFNYVGRELPTNEVYIYSIPFRGSQFFQKYTDLQLEALKTLINHLTLKYNIPTDYQGFDNLFKVSNKAIAGQKGIFTHCSFRADKSDLHPQPELLYILQNL